jgi:hypothetical protein
MLCSNSSAKLSVMCSLSNVAQAHFHVRQGLPIMTAIDP